MYVQCTAQHMYYTFVLSNNFLSSENEARFVFSLQRLFLHSFFISGVYDVRAKKLSLTSLRNRSIRSNDAKGTKSFDESISSVHNKKYA